MFIVINIWTHFRYHYVGIDGTEFSLAVAYDEGWNYLAVPESQGSIH